MDTDKTTAPVRNWFDLGGQAYARFRPEYPTELARFLATVAPDTALALDVGCGSGQLTVQLATHFEQVLGVDPSVDQLAHAPAPPHVAYACAPAEQLPLAAGSASLIAAAQAAHWFDLPRFFQEVRRVGAPHAAVALISYGVLQLDAELDARFSRFYHHEIGSYWPPERQLVDTGYVQLPFPFNELAAPALAIRKSWSLSQLLGYLSTWSAVRRAREAGRENLLQTFAAALSRLWGDPARVRELRWPIRMRLGTL